jgi:hypothetical protein
VTKTKRAHWRALESNKNIVANDNSEKPQNRTDDGAAGFSNAVACIFIVSQKTSSRARQNIQHWTGPVLQEFEMPEGLLLRAANNKDVKERNKNETE